MSTDPRTVAGYNSSAQAYHAHVSDPDESPFHSYYEKPAIRAELPSLKALSVISLGCGSGVDTRYLKDQGASRVVGIDISSGLIEIAKKNYADIEFHVMDMEQLGFPDESFDVAYSSFVFHYLKSWTRALSEVRRILKPGGKLIFSNGHPIGTAMERADDGKVQTKLLGRTAWKESGRYKIHGDYLVATEGGTKQVKVPLGPLDVYLFHRPVSKIVNDIVASGFTIEKMLEPLPIPTMKEKHGRFYDQLMKYPDTMIWVLRK